MIPEIKDVMHGKAMFDGYEDGKLWYRIMWFDNGFPKNFEFPVPVDLPDLYEAVQEAVYNLENLNEQILIETKELLEDSLDKAKRAGAGGGSFGPSGRWRRRRSRALHPTFRGCDARRARDARPLH